jgi:phosphate starvation-inducible membrane PsiE
MRPNLSLPTSIGFITLMINFYGQTLHWPVKNQLYIANTTALFLRELPSPLGTLLKSHRKTYLLVIGYTQFGFTVLPTGFSGLSPNTIDVDG